MFASTSRWVRLALIIHAASSLALGADPKGGAPVKTSTAPSTLPTTHGQVWREYDISKYTTAVREVAKPEQAIVDWILRETGTEVWFAEPLGLLNASGSSICVYHTPQMQDRVRGIVERFTAGSTDAQALGVRLITVGSPNWRARALSLVKPVDVNSPGVEAWLLSRENATLVYQQLKDRADFREHTSPHVEIVNGQSHTLSRLQTRSYVRGIELKREFPFYDTIPGKLQEGYSLQISPLLTIDGKTMEAAITCNVDQLEKLVPLAIDVPVGSQSQRVQIQVPQLASWRLSERFRWPANEVLLLSCGIVANPAPTPSTPLSMLSPLGISSTRADALLMIESHAQNVTGLATAPTMPPINKSAPPIVVPTSSSPVSRGRY